MLFFEPAAPPAAPCTLPCQRRPWCRRDRRDEGRMRLENKVAVVVGGGQSPGQGVGNGRAAAMLYAREGAKVLVVDRALASADETVADRKRVVQGKSVSVRVDIGGRRIL